MFRSTCQYQDTYLQVSPLRQVPQNVHPGRLVLGVHGARGPELTHFPPEDNVVLVHELANKVVRQGVVEVGVRWEVKLVLEGHAVEDHRRSRASDQREVPVTEVTITFVTLRYTLKAKVN